MDRIGSRGQEEGHKARHSRLCWVSPKRAKKQADTRRLKVRKLESLPLMKRTAKALEIDRRELPNRV